MKYHSAYELGILTHHQTSKLIGYTPVQLHLLGIKFGFPMPVDRGRYQVGWEQAAVEAWMRNREDLLLLR